MQDFRLLMISAMYENGGNVTHRFLDGHPQMYVYPFESQLGTKLVQDLISPNGYHFIKYFVQIGDSENTHEGTRYPMSGAVCHCHNHFFTFLS